LRRANLVGSPCKRTSSGRVRFVAMGQETSRPSGRPVLRHRPGAKKSPNLRGFAARGSGLRSDAGARPAGRSAPPELALIGWPETLPLVAKAGVALISDIQVAVSAAHTARPQDWRRTDSRRRRRSGGRRWLRRLASLILRGHSDGSRQSEDGKTDKNGSGHSWLFPRYPPQHQTTLADRGSRISSP
jgi:hypothetical protein